MVPSLVLFGEELAQTKSSLALENSYLIHSP